MPMNFRCPSCAQSMQCPEDYAGRKAACPKCGQRMVLPAPTAPLPNAGNKTKLADVEGTRVDAVGLDGFRATVQPIPVAEFVEKVALDEQTEDAPRRTEGSTEDGSLPLQITIAAALLIVAGFLLFACGLIEFGAVMNAPADPRAAPAIQRHLGTLIIISGFFGGIKFPLGLLTGLSGVGLLIRRRWCRLVAFVCLAGAILHDMTGRIFVAAILVPAANEFQKDLGRNGGFMHADAPIGSILIVQTVIGFIIAACVWAAFAVPVFLLLNSRSAKQYFAANRR